MKTFSHEGREYVSCVEIGKQDRRASETIKQYAQKIGVEVVSFQPRGAKAPMNFVPAPDALRVLQALVGVKRIGRNAVPPTHNGIEDKEKQLIDPKASLDPEKCREYLRVAAKYLRRSGVTRATWADGKLVAKTEATIEVG